MKKIALIFALFISQVCLAQDIPNGSFETWDNSDKLSPSTFSSIGQVSITSDKKVGEKAIKLENSRENGNSRFGAITNADFEKGFQYGGVPYDERPLSLKFWAKYDLTKDDKAHIICYFKSNATVIGVINFTIEGTSNNQFVEYSVPITWYNVGIPDSVTFFASSNSLYSSYVRGPGYIIFDDMHFQTISTRNMELENGDFEKWDTTTTLVPNSWYRTEDYLIASEGDDFGLKFTSKVEGRNGGSAIHLKNHKADQDVIAGVIITHSDFEEFLSPSFKVSRSWKYINGYYKFKPEGGDSAEIFVAFFKAGALIGGVDFRIGKAASDWTYFEMPLAHFGTSDSASIIISSADPDAAKGANTELWIDELKFSDWTANVENTSLNTFNLYPNPVSDKLYIDLKEDDGASVQLIDLTGKEVFNKQFTQSNIEINMSQHPKGVYHLIIENNNRIKTKKIVKI